ncbi:hypothetical protein SISNIDRAFT_489768 [Sistotremastrum niveocremeum HHB9708]|uniref:Tail specific protease domain-containing protein n=1 Tax=Sistotremastrum niveocremeum HHB9708 TaxID=1314777 RepID=A0A164PPP5_9AGAM|nr:hypothetical protein SISNIDRAFT_489768 [Sistotremastrum niveocremeum HHB9708]
MFFPRSPYARLLAFLSLISSTFAAPSASDPCAKIAGQTFSVPSDVLACWKSFPFNETIRDNVLEVHQKVFNFYTFEDYYLNSPPPFQESTTNIRAELARIQGTKYATDYDFNRDLYNFVTGLNDGHTRWFPGCYTLIWQNILPAPIVTLEVNGIQGVFIAPDSAEFLAQFPPSFAASLNGFDFNRLAGAQIVEIQGTDPFNYVDFIASTVSGNYLDHGVRVNSVFSSYRIAGGTLSQRLGDLAGPPFPDLDTIEMKVILANTTKIQTVNIPYRMDYLGPAFTDKNSYWAANCAVQSDTNGVDFNAVGPTKNQGGAPASKSQAKGNIITVDSKPGNALNLPPPFFPTVPPVDGTTSGVILSYILPDGKTGVMFVGSFEPNDFNAFQTDVVASINAFQAKGHPHPDSFFTGGFVCLGLFLHQYLAGSKIGYPGFETSVRGNQLAIEIVKANNAMQITDTFYSPVNWAFFNDTVMPVTHNYEFPVETTKVNGQFDINSQRFHDTCSESFVVPIPENPPFPLGKVALVGNGNCASTCSLFTTLMVERHGTKAAVFGGKPGEQVEYKGMAGNQVLEWADLDSEVKTAHLKSDPLAAPDLVINGNFRHNWRIAWSFLDESRPIAYVSEPAKFRFAYTKDTYNNPQNLWTFAAKQLF